MTFTSSNWESLDQIKKRTGASAKQVIEGVRREFCAEKAEMKFGEQYDAPSLWRRKGEKANG